MAKFKKSYVSNLLTLILICNLLPVFGQEKGETIIEKKVGNSVNKFPPNLNACIEELKKTLPADVVDDFKSKPVEVTNDYHLTLGMWIRNNWIRNSDGKLVNYFNKLGVYSFDDMSGIILDSFWKDLHNQPIELDKQVALYKKYWYYNGPEIREKRSLPTNIWDEPLLLQNGKTIKLSDLKNKILVLLLFDSDDTLTQNAISKFNILQNKYAKNAIVFIGFKETYGSKDKETSTKEYLSEFPVALVDSALIWKIAAALMSPGDLEYPDVILIGKDGNMIVRYHNWKPSQTSKDLDNEIQHALNSVTSKSPKTK